MQHSQQFNLRPFVKSVFFFLNKGSSSSINNPRIKVHRQKNTFDTSVTRRSGAIIARDVR